MNAYLYCSINKNFFEVFDYLEKKTKNHTILSSSLTSENKRN